MHTQSYGVICLKLLFKLAVDHSINNHVCIKAVQTQVQSFQKSAWGTILLFAMCMLPEIIGTEGLHLQIPLYFPIQTWLR